MGSSGQRLLLVEDDLDLAEGIGDFLARRGWQVAHARHGALALRLAAADATLTVDDEGPGFPDAGEEVRPRGYGLGLALARRLCETQGWTLRTARSPAGGARVSIQFPDAAVRSAAVA